MEKYDVIVIGGGPAGMVAAARAAECGKNVLLLEKMRNAGRKLLITGKGRCNITNSAPISEFITHVFPNGRFLKKVFNQYYSKEILALLERYKVDVTLERGGRYFPTSQKAKDILDALLNWCRDTKVEIRCGQKVDEIISEEDAVKGVISNGKKILADKVILATGGMSYPATGSTGDGYALAKTLGHTITKAIPALVPLETEGDLAQQLQGLNLRNSKAVIWSNGKKMGEAFGEMLFTHFGLSGPIILTLSRIAVTELQQNNKVEITIDLKPALDEQKLDLRLQRDLNEHGKKKLVNTFKLWLPSKLIPAVLNYLKIDGDKDCHQVSAKERKQIRYLMKNLPFKVSNYRSFKEAIITAGGIPTNEITAKNMESKLIKGLHFAGEVIDLDAETGGYNLQIAYSTGWVAGNC
ncbi:BaiN/RdsA family NAD(P)/FAD-dependent oxidoreductase [Carboxylicivirga linearis]|uniref:NAD(P)/FAD-dependent oxidoreductase n=1 Tax=Carboxylicivirga linearis TaxID=1628157 RepID=A0ABS5JVP6_9BACT|nr:NAD(P)/FAD-dependent oxidoreductase [Carboxylicivirga linearis]MBS2098988.1 NAD(P)/FAD-dependent oxidoreductase [Carboxylicivirga linearis]